MRVKATKQKSFAAISPPLKNSIPWTSRPRTGGGGTCVSTVVSERASMSVVGLGENGQRHRARLPSGSRYGFALGLDRNQGIERDESPLVDSQRRGGPPRFGPEERANELHRLIHDARPEEDLVRAVTLLAPD